MQKRSLLRLGAITLFVFPIPTFIVLYFVEGTTPIEILQLENLYIGPIVLGTVIGMMYALLALLIMQAPVFKKLPTRIEHMIADLKLTFWDCVFLSICAGVGEELLFRSGVQFYLGPLITSFIFVAIHGYLNPMNWRMSLYGLLVLPFIFLISYGFYEFGLWFSIAAHFSYDLILFLAMRESTASSE